MAEKDGVLSEADRARVARLGGKGGGALGKQKKFRMVPDPDELRAIPGHDPAVADAVEALLQKDGGNRPKSVPINIWTMQCLLTEAPEEKLPFSASIERAGVDLKVRIVNHSDAAIRRGYIRMDRDQKMEFGSVDAGGNKAHQGRLSPARGWDDCLSSSGSYVTAYPNGREAVLHFDTDSAYFARGSLRRTSAIQEYLRRGAAVVCVEYREAPVSFGVAGRTCEYSHIRLARMVVFPKQVPRLP